MIKAFDFVAQFELRRQKYNYVVKACLLRLNLLNMDTSEKGNKNFLIKNIGKSYCTVQYRF